MTRLERKRQQLEKLYEYRRAAMKRNDLLWMTRNAERIDALEKEIIELQKYAAATVFSVLSDKEEMVKNDVYKSLLRISLMADACNEACEVAKSKLAEYGIIDFSFRQKVKDLCRLSHEIANVTLKSNNKTLEDFIVDNETFVDMCMKHADAHLKRKLKL